MIDELNEILNRPVETQWLDPDYDGYFDDTEENLIRSGYRKVTDANTNLTSALKVAVNAFGRIIAGGSADANEANFMRYEIAQEAQAEILRLLKEGE